MKDKKQKNAENVGWEAGEIKFTCVEKYRKHLEIAQRTEWQTWCMCISKTIYRIKYNCI